MKRKGERLQLHIHLSLIRNLSFKEQEKIFREALEWLNEEVGITPTEFVPGWWKYNQDTLKVLKKEGLKLIHYSDYNSTHDYCWID